MATTPDKSETEPVAPLTAVPDDSCVDCVDCTCVDGTDVAVDCD